jgi:transcription factor IIIB 90 kDa subunit
MERSPHLLIDFSDALLVNVYVLGKAFLQFCRLLNLQMTPQLKVVDPALFLHRFAGRMDLGEENTS